MMDPSKIEKGLRVVTNNARWGTVVRRSCSCEYTELEHGEDPELCSTWDGWWDVAEDDGRTCLQNAERLSLHGMRMFDGSYLPSYTDPKATETVVAGRGTKVHSRYAGSMQTICGQGLGSRGGRTSQLRVVDGDVTCSRCIEKEAVS